MEFIDFIRKPFKVKGVLITEENMEEIAALVGKMADKEGERYIALDKRVIPNVRKAYVGWFLTQLGDNYRCYSPKVFREQFESCGENGILDVWFQNQEEAVEDEPDESATQYDLVVDGEVVDSIFFEEDEAAQYASGTPTGG